MAKASRPGNQAVAGITAAVTDEERYPDYVPPGNTTSSSQSGASLSANKVSTSTKSSGSSSVKSSYSTGTKTGSSTGFTGWRILRIKCGAREARNVARFPRVVMLGRRCCTS